MKELHQSIFPGGFAQMEAEINEVRSLFDYKYTKEDTKRTYTQATAIFYLAKDKNQDRIVASILTNKLSVITKSDAIKLYQYLLKKFKVKSGKEEIADSKALKLFLVARSAIGQVENEFRILSNAGKFEALVLNSLLALRFFRDHHDGDFTEEFEEEYHLYLFEQAKLYNPNLNPEKLIDFINFRFKFYSGEFQSLCTEEGYICAKIYSAFYISPLSIVVAPSSDLGQLLIFHQSLIKMIRWLETIVRNQV